MESIRATISRVPALFWLIAGISLIYGGYKLYGSYSNISHPNEREEALQRVRMSLREDRMLIEEGTHIEQILQRVRDIEEDIRVTEMHLAKASPEEQQNVAPIVQELIEIKEMLLESVKKKQS